MKPVNICVVVFNRYDLLTRLCESVSRSTVAPAAVYVIDRGHNSDAVYQAVSSLINIPIYIVPLPGQSLPEAWNWFLKNVPEERILASDDVEFHADTIEVFANTPGDLLGIQDGRSSHFACFLLRDSCIEKIGYFDETISPDYMYFEDSDYGYRMKLAGVQTVGIECLTHVPAQSWFKKTEAQRQDHHRRFVLAESNYIRKWGGKPFHETFTTAYGV